MAEVTSGDVTVIVLDKNEAQHLERVLSDWSEDANTLLLRGTWLPRESYDDVKEDCLRTFHALFELGQALGVSFTYEGE